MQTCAFHIPEKSLKKREHHNFKNIIYRKVSNLKVLVERITHRNLSITLLGQIILPVSSTVQTKKNVLNHPTWIYWLKDVTLMMPPKHWSHWTSRSGSGGRVARPMTEGVCGLNPIPLLMSCCARHFSHMSINH